MFSEQRLDLQNEQRIFTIAANDYFQMVILPRVLDRLRQHAPHYSISCTPFVQDLSDTGIMSGQTDFAFGRHHDTPDNLVMRPAMSDNLACLVSAHNTQIKQTISIELFEQLQHIVVKPAGKLKTGIFKILQKQSIQRHVACTVSNFNSVPSLIAGTDYIAVLPTRICQQFAQNKQLQVYDVPPELMGHDHFPFHLSWHRRYQQDASHQWLRQQIMACCDFSIEC